MYRLKTIGLLFLLFFGLVLASPAAAQPPHAGGEGWTPPGLENIPDHAASRVPLAPGNRPGLIQTNRNVFYGGEPLQVRIVLPRNLRAFWSGDADAHLMLWVQQEPGEGQNQEAFVVSIPLFEDNFLPDQPANLIDITLDEEVPAASQYQFAIVLTVPDGDPTNLEDWYNGFSGLISSTRIKLSPGPDPEDSTGDGFIDNDENGDGYADDVEDDEDEEEDEEDDDELEEENGGDE
jgi:hypothetical protein